ncbi:MAG TPA: heparinase II/III family protein, partial [Gemmatimonadaceae bacterium]|nr:heparinase II/III family protein [Gemmatimonadaceae bacterium]
MLDHRFALLGARATDVSASLETNHGGGTAGGIDAARAKRFRDLTTELPAEHVGRYRVIEWHSDFTSGYRWDPAAYYLDVRVAPVAGADIKIPRELSRFQHVGLLGAAGTTDGFRRRAGIEAALELMDWIAANPVRRGVNWASPMDVAIRAVNWIWALRLFADVFVSLPQTTSHVTKSLYEHALHLEKNLEFARERTTNHYLANVAGLLYVGASFPQFPESDQWLHFALQELVSETTRQVYPDGAGYEASTHYHRLAAEMLLSCAALAERLPLDRRRRLYARGANALPSGPPLRPLVESDVATPDRGRLLPDGFYDRLSRMAEFTAALTKPNGRVPQFGDNDSGRLHKLSSTDHEDVR